MPKIKTAQQQFALQQKIARKSINEYQPKIKSALQSDFNKAAQLVKELGVSQVANYKTFFDRNKINDILRTLYEGTGGYTAMRYQEIFSSFKKEDTINIDPQDVLDEWTIFMLSYWLSISVFNMAGIENTTNNEIVRIINEAIYYGRINSLTQDQVDSLAIQILREGKINNARSLLIARTETHQAIGTGAMSAATRINIPLLKQWVHAEYIAKPRAWHRQLDNQTNPDTGGVRIPVNQPFLVNGPNGTIEMQYAHDNNGGAINNCNCRCCTVYV